MNKVFQIFPVTYGFICSQPYKKLFKTYFELLNFYIFFIEQKFKKKYKYLFEYHVLEVMT